MASLSSKREPFFVRFDTIKTVFKSSYKVRHSELVVGAIVGHIYGTSQKTMVFSRITKVEKCSRLNVVLKVQTERIGLEHIKPELKYYEIICILHVSARLTRCLRKI